MTQLLMDILEVWRNKKILFVSPCFKEYPHWAKPRYWEHLW